MLYYSAETNAVYDDQVHGTRTLFIEDEAAQKAKLKRLSDDEKGLHELLEANQDKDLAKTYQGQIDAIAEVRRLALLNPPLKEVENPDCRLPADAVPITAEKHAELMAAQGEGKTFRPGADGQPVIVERERSPEEVLLALRALRRKVLADTDYIELPSFKKREGAEVQKKWLDYRDGLRDLPARFEEAMDKGASPAEMMGRIVEFISAGRPA